MGIPKSIISYQGDGYGLLGHNTTQFRDSLKFWRNISPPSSGSKSNPRKKRGEIGSNLIRGTTSRMMV
jgi:hypothetical protein